MNQALTSYYNDRAKEYDKVYQIPEEQADLLTASSLFQNIFSGKHIIEIACGTGYWTEQISKTATSIMATDINKSVTDIAIERQMNDHVRFNVADMYTLSITEKYEGLFGGFIWSHILLQDLDTFLNKVKNLVTVGAALAFIDSNPVEGTVHDTKRIARTDEHGNTYQERKLDDGSTHMVLKNFPSEGFLCHKLSGIAKNIEYRKLEHYWIVTCKCM